MWARTSAFVVWALVAASAVLWALKLSAKPLPVPPDAAVATSAGPALGTDWSPLIGAAAPAPPAAAAEPAAAPEASRFQLVGVAAGRRGVALIAVDGKPARAWRVGSVIDGELVVQRIAARAVELGPRGGAARITLELPPPAPPATGVPGGSAAPVAPVPLPMPPPGAVPPAGVPGMPPGAPAPGVPPAGAVAPGALAPGAAGAHPPGVVPPNPVVLPQHRMRGLPQVSHNPDGGAVAVQPDGADGGDESARHNFSQPVPR